MSGTTGGTFASSPPGITLNNLTGEIVPGTSASGTYLITYSIQGSGGCGLVQATTDVDIGSSSIVTTSPEDMTVVYPADASFGIQAEGFGLSYQWQVNTGNGFVNITNTGVYSGAFTDTLHLESPPPSMNDYKYRAVVSGTCAPKAISGEATLFVKLKEFELKISAEGINKVYDGNTNAEVIIHDNRQPGDQLTITYTRANFDTKNVGSGKTVFVSGIMVTGPDADKYGFNTGITAEAEITPKPITITADPGLSKYFGSPDPAFTYTYTPELIKGDQFTGILTRVPGENPGIYQILQGTLSLDSNYAIKFISNNFEINYKSLIHVIITAGQTKVYGEADPILSYTYYPHLDEGDCFTGQLSRVQGENIGEYQIIRGTLSADPKYGIYLVPSTLSITPKPVTVSAVPDVKVYDGTTASDKKLVITPNLVFDDTPEFIQTFDNKNVGTGKTMSPSGRVNDGNGGKNYMITFVAADIGVITPKSISGSITAADKIYYASVAATLLKRTLDGVISGDEVRYSGGTATFETPTVGQEKTVAATGFSLLGTDAFNYAVNSNAFTKASINVRVVETSLAVNSSTFTHYSDQVTLTATVYGGAPLANGLQAAGSTTFSIHGHTLRDHSGNENIPLLISGSNLEATITVSVIETSVTGSMVPGIKEASAFFNDENINYDLIPNPAKSTFDYRPGYNILVYPNPSPGPVNFKISVDLGTSVTLDLYQSNGELVARVFEGFIATGESRTIPFTAYLAQGIYRYRARIGNEIKQGNVIIIGVY